MLAGCKIAPIFFLDIFDSRFSAVLTTVYAVLIRAEGTDSGPYGEHSIAKDRASLRIFNNGRILAGQSLDYTDCVNQTSAVLIVLAADHAACR